MVKILTILWLTVNIILLLSPLIFFFTVNYQLKFVNFFFPTDNLIFGLFTAIV